MLCSLHMLLGLFTLLQSKKISTLFSQNCFLRFLSQRRIIWYTWSSCVSLTCRTKRFDIPLKLAILVALPALFGLWLGLSIAISVLVGVGYGFFTPWISAFEAFRQDTESNKFFHCLVVFYITFPPKVS